LKNCKNRRALGAPSAEPRQPLPSLGNPGYAAFSAYVLSFSPCLHSIFLSG